MVVHVAVEGRGHVRAGHAVGLLGAHRVGVGLGDDADAGPAGVAQDHGLGRRGAQGQAQQGVVGDGRPERGGVVPELADLRGRLVDEGEVPVGDPHGPGDEAEVVVPTLQQGPDRRGVEVEAVAVDQDVDPRAVPAPHLEAVEGGQDLLQGQMGLDRRRTGIGPGQTGDLGGGGQPVATQGPRRVAEGDEGGIDPLQLGAGAEALGVVQRPLDGIGPGLDPGGEAVQGRRQGRIGQEGLHAGRPPQEPVGGHQGLGGRRQEIGQRRPGRQIGEAGRRWPRPARPGPAVRRWRPGRGQRGDGRQR